jgi:RHS repeat-associated protein
VFDALGRVTEIVHQRAATELADYDLTWDAAGRITDFDFSSLVGDDGTGEYSYDDTNQLTDADYDFQTDETYTYDSNGNRTITGYTTGDHNRLTSDGTYNYTYDNEGNVTSKTNISDSTSVEYTWDHGNRLIKVTFKDDEGTPTKTVEYAYDHSQRWVRKLLDTNGDGTPESQTIFVHDEGQIVLDLYDTGTADLTNADLANRYLWGSAIDELLAEEAVDDGTADDVAWALGDHLNSVRDLVVYDPTPGTVSVAKHVTYDAFGNVTSDTAPTAESLFLYTARPFDAGTALQNNLNRWYDPAIGRWMSADPIGFEGSDANLYRYVHSTPLNNTDPFRTIRLLWDILPNPLKCAFVRTTLFLCGGFWDGILLYRWFSGTGKSMILPFNLFDSGSERSSVMQMVIFNAELPARRLACGGSKSGTWSQPPIEKKTNINMISHYMFSANCTYSTTKQCDANGCCTSINISVSCKFTATDTVEFWNIDPNIKKGRFGIPGSGVYIADRLVRACFPKGRGFTVSSILYHKESLSPPCCK